jgi:uridine monophosphate synthetase
MGFFTALEARARAIDSLLCVGLDPHVEQLPEATAAAAAAFCLGIVEQTRDVAVAYKPNAAFFERFGADGVAALAQVIAAIPDEIPVLLDAKRGDISSTARAYADAVFHAMGAQAVTLNAYLGYDAVEPFIEDANRGVFVLCKTSNPGSTDLQDLEVGDGVTLYEHVAALCSEWNDNDNVGVVVGATHADALARVRAAAPSLWILAPGVGAQGGDLNAALAAGLRPDGMGVLVPVSRGISKADNPGVAARDLRDRINKARASVSSGATPARPSSPRSELAASLLDIECVKFGEFTLKSGKKSPIYIDLRRLISSPAVLTDVAEAYVDLLDGLQFDHVAALPYAALPIGTAVALAGDWSMVYPRKEAKEYGTKVAVEGVFGAGEIAVVVDDLATTGASKFEAFTQLERVGLAVRDVVVLIDRESGATGALAAAGYTMHALFTLTELLDIWEADGRVPAEQIAATRDFLAAQ